MRKSFALLSILGIAVVLSGCARQEEEVIYVEPEPTYNKF